MECVRACKKVKHEEEEVVTLSLLYILMFREWRSSQGGETRVVMSDFYCAEKGMLRLV